MKPILIGIHGLGNKPPRELLEGWWRNAIEEGLSRYGKRQAIPEFELVYWADILYDKPLDPDEKDPESPYFLDEPYLPAPADFEPEESPVWQKILDFLEPQLDKLFLNDDYSINYQGLSDAIIHRYFKDLDVYYTTTCQLENQEICQTRHLIRDRLQQALEKHQHRPITLIAHSMGSIIAYDVLTFRVPELKIDNLVTIGSPLGFPVVQGKIAAEWHEKRLLPPRLKTPPGVTKQWYNLANLKDKVALIYQLGKNFETNWRGVAPEDLVVQNDYSAFGEPNHHKSFGYLRCREMTDILSEISAGRGLLYRVLTRIFGN